MKNLIWTKRFGRGFFMGPILAGLLAGCGGSSATTPKTEDPEIPSTSLSALAAMQSDQTAMISTYPLPNAYTPLASIPISGTYVYDGYLSGGRGETLDALTDIIIGDLKLSVEFGNSSDDISGSASNFHDEDGALMTGSLTFSSGELDRSGDPISDATLTLTVSGRLTDADINTLDFSGNLEGDTLGTNYNALGGDALFNVSENSGTSEYFTGIFIAER